MSEIRKIVADIESVFAESNYPADFLAAYDQMECLASHSGRETFLVRRKSDGMQAVAKCFDIKVFPIHPDPELFATLSGPGLPEFYESFRNDRICCTVREYIEGTPLNLYAREKTLSQDEILSIAGQLCDILDTLHSHTPPIIHRDIKPENIIIGPEGQVTLIDFDISRVFRPDSDADSVVFGTKGYAPPEQYGFEQTDHRADIHAFGVLLRWLVTGSVRPNPNIRIDPDLQQTIDRCTAFSPDDRFANIREVKASLARTGTKRLRFSKAVLLCSVLCAVLFLILGFALGRYTGLFRPKADAEQPLHFTEPLIEAAVRAQLGIGENTPVYAADAAKVDRLYIFGNEVFDDPGVFFEQNLRDHTRGSIRTLEDLVWMPYLEELRVVYQGSVDISVLSGLKNLRSVELKHMNLTDIHPLAEIPMLREAGLFDTGISDVTVLSECRWLESLDVGSNPIYSAAQIGVFTSLRCLGLRQLKLETLDWLVSMPSLQEITVARAEIGSLSALSRLPKLTTVYGTPEQREAVETALSGTSAVFVEVSD